jgi:hypothetical protein
MIRFDFIVLWMENCKTRFKNFLVIGRKGSQTGNKIYFKISETFSVSVDDFFPQLTMIHL